MTVFRSWRGHVQAMRGQLVRASLLAAVLATATGSTVVGQEASRIRVLHASPDAPAVDVYLDGAIVADLTNVPFGGLSGYLTVPSGDHEIKVTPTGTTTAVIETTITLEAGRSYTIAAIGPVTSIAPKVIVDDPQPTAGKVKVRVVHLSPDAPAVDVAPDGAEPSGAIVMNLAYPNATGYLTLAPGRYDLELRPTGTTDVALDLDPLDLESGRAYSVFAIGSAASEPLGGNALRALVAIDAVAPPATDTAATGGASMPPPIVLAALLAAAAVIAVAFIRRLGAMRAR